MNICQKKCFGIDNHHGSCCTLENRNYIIGPIRDHQNFLEKLRLKFSGVEILWDDVFFSFEEGSKLFPHLSNWQQPENFPAFRVNTKDEKRPCVFYNMALKSCGVYEIRPETCRNFYCDYLRSTMKDSETTTSEKT